MRVYPRKRPAEITALDARFARAVRDLLTAAVGASGSPLATRIHDRLAGTFRNRVSATVLPPHYVWLWVVDHWEWVCLDGSSLEVRLTDQLVTVVDVDDVEVMR